ncbi:Heterokaryon incompatibility protein (HET) domain containing protein [Naviculisporaceae sp. PSN 640]
MYISSQKESDSCFFQCTKSNKMSSSSSNGGNPGGGDKAGGSGGGGGALAWGRRRRRGGRRLRSAIRARQRRAQDLREVLDFQRQLVESRLSALGARDQPGHFAVVGGPSGPKPEVILGRLAFASQTGLGWAEEIMDKMGPPRSLVCRGKVKREEEELEEQVPVKEEEEVLVKEEKEAPVKEEGDEEDGPFPPWYAILSHTWDNEEVNFQQIQDLEVAKTLKGWTKIEKTCEFAAAMGIEYAWIDTCCIDKSSSAELSEAINSMFRWYKDSAVCFVWLSDLRCSTETSTEEDFFYNMSKCRWFSRGWTLQELIAPREILFYDYNWTVQGTKRSLLTSLAKITSIDHAVLANDADLSTVPVARRMAWAHGRVTTRVENMAYSLLGIFDVNMPMIYGEGEKAFLRLQEAIALNTDDLSLFAWSEVTGAVSAHHVHRPQGSKWHGIFASCACQFASCINLVNVQNPLHYYARAFTIANKTLEFLACLSMDHRTGEYVMDLHCEYRRANSPKGSRAAIRLMKTPHGFARYTTRIFEVNSEASYPMKWEGFPRPVNIPKQISLAESERMPSQFRNSFRFWTKAPQDWRCKISITDPEVLSGQLDGRLTEPSFWDPCRVVFLTESHPNFVGLLYVCVSRVTIDPVAEPLHSPALLFCGFSSPVDSEGTERQLLPWVHLQASLSQVGSGDRLTNDITIVLEDKNAKDPPTFTPISQKMAMHLDLDGRGTSN